MSADFVTLVLGRWLHIMAGVMWIGLLYYFNFVQVDALKAAAARHDAGLARTAQNAFVDGMASMAVVGAIGMLAAAVIAVTVLRSGSSPETSTASGEKVNAPV